MTVHVDGQHILSGSKGLKSNGGFGFFYMEVTVIFFFQQGISSTTSSPNSKLSVTLTLILEDKGLLALWPLLGSSKRSTRKGYKVRMSALPSGKMCMLI